MIKLIASDLDGTLLRNGAQEINPEIFDLILRLKEKDIHFAAASGRQLYSQRCLFAPVKDEISYIAENGSLCICQGKVISKGIIERSLGLQIIKASREFGSCHTLLSCESRCYTDSDSQEFIRHMRDELHNDIHYCPDLTSITEPFLKLAACDFHGTTYLLPYFKEKFGEKVYKLALDGGMTCPNRDGRCGTRGCIFCSEGGSGEFAEPYDGDVARQILRAVRRVDSSPLSGILCRHNGLRARCRPCAR